MTTLTPILYADGALRLTDHGPRGGGLVLVHTASGQQCTIDPDFKREAERRLERSAPAAAADDFQIISKCYSQIGKFHHFYHG